MKIAIILGSVREDRKSDKVATYLMRLLEKQFEVETIMLDLLDYSFPVMKERFRLLENPSESMSEFSTILNQSDGIIIVTPEYNGSYSGALKNTLDYYKQEYVRKPMGVVTVSSGSWGGINASHHLLSWILHVKAIPSPYKLMIQNVNSVFKDNNELLDEKFEGKASDFLKEFIWLTGAISRKD